MSLFKLEKGNVVIDMDIICNTPPYQTLWEKDKLDGKETAVAQFKLIFHLYDRRSQYNTSATYSRFTKIIADLFPNLVDWEKKVTKDKQFVPAKDKVFHAAATHYLQSLELVPEYALLEGAQNAVHDIATKLKDPANDDKTEQLKKMRTAMEDLNAVRKMVKEAEEAAQVTKGKHAVKKREDPDYILNR